MRYCTRGPGLVGSALPASDSPALLEWYQSVVCEVLLVRRNQAVPVRSVHGIN